MADENGSTITAVGASGTEPAKSFRGMGAPSLPFVLVLIAAVVATYILYLSASALVVLALGGAVAFLLTPVVNRLERRGWKRVAAAGVVVLLVVVTFVVIVFVTLYIVFTQGTNFVNALPGFLETLNGKYQALNLPDWMRQTLDPIVQGIYANLSSITIDTWVAGFLHGTLSLLGGLAALLLLPFFMLYVMLDQPKMASQFYLGVPRPWRDDVSKVITICISDFALYFKAEFIVGSIMFFVIGIGMFVIGLIVGGPLGQFALLLGLLAFALELIPQVGSIISYIPALLLALVTSWEAVVLVSAYYFIAFNIEGSVLVPSLEGKIISFHGATVLILITIGFALGGILGAILALPVASIVRDIFVHFFRKAQIDGGIPAEEAPATAKEEEAATAELAVAT